MPRPMARPVALWWERLEEGLAGGCAALALLLATYEIVARYFYPPLAQDWSHEVVVYLVVWAVFLTGFALVRRDRHVRADLVIRRLSPGVQRVLETVNSALALAFCLTMTWYGYEAAAFARMLDIRSDSSLLFPLYYYYLCLPVGMGLMSVGYAVRLWRYVFTFDAATMTVAADAPQAELRHASPD